MAAGNILLLEQNQRISQTMDSAFQRSGFHIRVLPWGEDLLLNLSSHPVDVVLMNIKQLGTSARSLCMKIREEPQYKRFPLLILYGKQGKESRSDWMKLGIDDFVPMPFTPIELVSIVEGRLRPFTDIHGKTSLSKVDRQFQVPKEEKQPLVTIPARGDLETVPLTAILARIFFKHETGILTTIVKKETRTIFFEAGSIAYAESSSRKDDLGDFMARNGAGKGTGKEVIAARNQAGGPGCDPREFRLILYEAKLMEPKIFNWWVHMHCVDLMAMLFGMQVGTYQWQTLPLPERAKDIGFIPIYTPRVIFEGIRQLTKWWNYRQLLPAETMIPSLADNFDQQACEYGLTLKETTMLSVVNGRRTLKEIREICHQAAQMIDNFIYACQQLNLIQFDAKEKTAKTEIDIHEEITEAVEKETSQPEPTRHAAKASISNGPQQASGQSQHHDEDFFGLLDESNEEILSQTPTPAMPDFSRAKQPPIAVTDSKPPEPVSITPPVATPAPVQPAPPEPIEQIFGSGKLSDRPVPEIFRAAMKREFSGALCIESIGIKKTIFWKRGKIITATSTDIDERLDNFLYRRHTITAQQRDEIRQGPQELIGSPNEMLKRRILSIEQIFKVVKDQIESIIKDLFCWSEGDFRFDSNFQAPRDMVPLDISPIAIVMGALRELPAWEHLESKLPLENEIIRITERNRSDPIGLNLSPVELRIMNIIVESLPVYDIVRRTGQPLDIIRKSLYAMEVTGLIQRLGQA